MAFTGFTDETFAFYETLQADNNRAFWQANKHRYQSAVRAPLDALLAELDAYGPFHVFRPYKDVRFSKEKIPYKDHQGAYGESEGGAGFYVQVSATGLMAATGYYAMASDQLARFREAVDHDARAGGFTGQRQRAGAVPPVLSDAVAEPVGDAEDENRREQK